MIKLFFDKKEVEIETWSFPAGDQGVRILDTLPTDGGHTEIIASLTSSDEVLQLVLLADALDRILPYTSKVHLYLKYIPYAQQDRVCNTGEALSAEIMADIINYCVFSNVWILDPHSDKIVNHINNAMTVGLDDLVDSFPETLAEALSTCVMICPDKGAVSRVTALSSAYEVPVIYGHKKRDTATGQITDIGIPEENRVDLTGKTVVIVDDMCLGGGTFIPHAKDAREMGAEKVVLLVTHGIFNQGLEKFSGIIDEIYCTDSYDPHEVNTDGYTGTFERFPL